MPDSDGLIQGEFVRTFDTRCRVTLPTGFVEALGGVETEVTLAKQRPGCLSVWNARRWNPRLESDRGLFEAKLMAGKLQQRLLDVQRLGRLLSTRHASLRIDARGRLLIPEGFREFLQAQRDSSVMVIGAAVCVEIWLPQRWMPYLRKQIPSFRRLFDDLTASGFPRHDCNSLGAIARREGPLAIDPWVSLG
jgi:MraZ protein